MGILRSVYLTITRKPPVDVAEEARKRSARAKDLSKKSFEEIDRELGVTQGSGVHPHGVPKYLKRQKTLTEADRKRILGE